MWLMRTIPSTMHNSLFSFTNLTHVSGRTHSVGEDITRFEVDHDIAWVLIVEKEV